MTFLAILLDLLIFSFGLFIVLMAHGSSYNSKTNKRNTIIASVIIAIILIGTIIFQLWYYSNTEVGQRAMKTQETKLGDGIERVITVYDINGNIIKTYEGKFDITYDSNDSDGLIWDDEQGKRHIIYYTTGTITVDEK